MTGSFFHGGNVSLPDRECNGVSLLAEVVAADTVFSRAEGGLMNNANTPVKGGYFSITEPCEVHNRVDPAYDGVELDPIPDADRQRMADGVAREAVVSVEWAALLGASPLPKDILALAGKGSFNSAVAAVTKRLRGRSIVWIPECTRSDASKRRREVLSVAAMTAGAEFIWNARLPMKNGRISEPDFLVRAQTADATPGYRPGDVKDAKSLEGSAKEKPWVVSPLDSFLYEDATRRQIGAGRPKHKHSMQLAHYFVHLDDLGFAAPGNAWAAILGREGVLVWRNLSEKSVKVDGDMVSTLDAYRSAFEFRLEVEAAAQDPDQEPLVGPELKTACGSCQYRTVCHDEMVELDHVTLLAGVTPARAKVHYEAGVTRRNDLAKLDWRTAKVLASGCDVASILDASVGLPSSTSIADLVGARKKNLIADLESQGITSLGDLANLHSPTAELYRGLTPKRLPEEIDQARVVKVGKVHLRRGVERLVMPRADIEVDVDFENDSTGIIYLWGTHLHIREKSFAMPGPQYRPFVTWTEGDEADEARVFGEFWGWLHALMTIAASSGLSFRGYFYSEAENRGMRHLARKHAGRPGVPTIEQVDALIDSDLWCDMYPLATKSLLWPTETLSVKDTAKWARHSWSDPDASGDSSTKWHRDALYGDTVEIREVNRQRLLAYNKDDCLATLVLRNWLETLSNGSSKIPRVEALNTRFVRSSPRRTTNPRRVNR